MYQTPDRAAVKLLEKARAVETKAILVLRRAATPLLRVSLGAVFIWFGGLKAAGVSPVTDIVTGTLPGSTRTCSCPPLERQKCSSVQR